MKKNKTGYIDYKATAWFRIEIDADEETFDKIVSDVKSGTNVSELYDLYDEDISGSTHLIETEEHLVPGETYTESGTVEIFEYKDQGEKLVWDNSGNFEKIVNSDFVLDLSTKEEYINSPIGKVFLELAIYNTLNDNFWGNWTSNIWQVDKINSDPHSDFMQFMYARLEFLGLVNEAVDLNCSYSGINSEEINGYACDLPDFCKIKYATIKAYYPDSKIRSQTIPILNY
jgi:hypothetical protein